MRALKVYLAGPITDNPHFEEDFSTAAAAWRAAGWEVVNPVEMDHHDNDHTWVEYMKRDIPYLIDCDAIALLPGWQYSDGASLEQHIAAALFLRIYDAKHPARHPAMHEYTGPNKCCLVPEYWHIDYVLANREAA